MQINYIQAMEVKKDLWEILLWALVSLILLIFLAETKITFKPFSISFGRWHTAIGWMLVISGIMFLQFGSKIELLKKHGKELEELNDKAKFNLERSSKMLKEMEDLKAKKEMKDSLSVHYKKQSDGEKIQGD